MTTLVCESSAQYISEINCRRLWESLLDRNCGFEKIRPHLGGAVSLPTLFRLLLPFILESVPTASADLSHACFDLTLEQLVVDQVLAEVTRNLQILQRMSCLLRRRW